MRHKVVVTHLDTGDTTTETMSAIRFHLGPRWAPIRYWFQNRWNWRKGRQVRKEILRLRALAVPASEVVADVDPDVRRLAIVLDGSPALSVLDLGYGLGEGVIIAAVREPRRMAPYLEAVLRYTDDEIVGVDSARGHEAVRARNELIREARAILSENPKTNWSGPEFDLNRSHPCAADGGRRVVLTVAESTGFAEDRAQSSEMTADTPNCTIAP